ncbi:MAG: desulfoferrodoxin [Oscillospiraceae bacterium]|nr:desulfoferrodoxin [Oscillospiraceae bacterium]
MKKFFLCKICGNLTGLIESSGVPMICCGEPMTELIPNTEEAAVEKHLPAVKTEDGVLTVHVGSILHPMLPEHHISFVYVETANGGQRKMLKIGEEPICRFTFIDDAPVAVYAYCNLHGMWKTDV